MKIGVLASSGGSAFIAAYNILEKHYPQKYTYFVVTDRPCGIEDFCREKNIPIHRIDYVNREDFSFKALNYFHSIGGVDVILLYFLRIITKTLFESYLCLNIHPALLPAFRGTNAVEQCLQSQSKFIGATLHLVDAGIDTGQLIAQVVTPIKATYTTKIAEKISFLQKVYLSLIAIDLLSHHRLHYDERFTYCHVINTFAVTHYANPALEDSLFLASFQELEDIEQFFITRCK